MSAAMPATYPLVLMEPTEFDPTVIAVDWSGAKKPGRCIWLTAVRDGRVVFSDAMKSRETAVARVIECEPPVIAGFDFSFSVPAWFARELGCERVADVWDAAAKYGDEWLAPTPPFWNARRAGAHADG